MKERDYNIHVAAAGLGVNTIAMLILCTKQGIKFDYILFSDPGKEHKGTYAYIKIINEWLVKNDQPEIQTLYQLNNKSEFVGLYNDCLAHNDLPSIAFGFKKCSVKYKLQPFEKFFNNNEAAKLAWQNGGKIIKYKGYDADEGHRTQVNYSDKRYENKHPLVDAEMGRCECVKMILDEGLPLPPKSSCTFCPSMKPWEIIELYEKEPSEYYDAIQMERNAKGNLTSVKGLGRDYSWFDLIVAYKYLKLVQKHKSMGNVPDRIKRLMNKVSKSRPVDYEKLSKGRQAPKDAVCDLFKQSIDMPCDCMN